MTIWPFGPAGHRPSRLPRSARSSRIRAHAPLGPGEPGDEPARGVLRVRVRIARADRAGRPREPGADRVPAACGDPDQDVDRPGVPQRVGELHGQLRLAGTALGGRGRLGLLAVGQHHGLAGKQARLQVDPRLQALEVGVDQGRDDPRHQHLPGRRRSGPLRDHVNSLSRGTRRPAGDPASAAANSSMCERPLPPRSWPSATLEPGPSASPSTRCVH